jgi:uncharacterized phage protein gp47/JayE
MSTFNYTHHEAPESTALRTIWYNNRTGDLVVEFTSGVLAGYRNVPAKEYDSLVNAYSVGQYYTHYVKNRYSGFSVDQDTTFVLEGSVDAKDESALSVFKITASVASDVSLTVEGADLEAALASFRARIEEAMKGNPVTISFKSAVTE